MGGYLGRKDCSRVCKKQGKVEKMWAPLLREKKKGEELSWEATR